MTAIFVTGTGTDVGKTFITAALIRQARAAGRSVGAIKPVVSGFDPNAPQASDPAVLLAALGRAATPQAIDDIAPWRFAAPLSPDMAAAREGQTVDFDAVLDFCRRALREPRDLLLIEGIGGIMVPLDASHTVLDWIAELSVPLLLVAGSYVGTLSHTLTALQVIGQRGLDVRAVAVSESQGSAATLDDTVAALARLAPRINVTGIPRLADAAGHLAIAQIARLF